MKNTVIMGGISAIIQLAGLILSILFPPAGSWVGVAGIMISVIGLVGIFAAFFHFSIVVRKCRAKSIKAHAVRLESLRSEVAKLKAESEELRRQATRIAHRK